MPNCLRIIWGSLPSILARRNNSLLTRFSFAISRRPNSDVIANVPDLPDFSRARFKPSVDTRYDNEMVVSHNKNEIRSTPVPVAENIRILAQGCDVIGIDEAQFFDEEIVAVCNDLANSGIRVIVAGLDMDFKGNPFGPMPALMATAEYVTKVHAVCTHTGNLAHYSFRKSKDEKLVMLGENEEYEPLSRAAYFKAMRQNKEEKE